MSDNLYQYGAKVEAVAEILRGGGTLIELVCTEPPSVQCDGESVLKMSMSGSFVKPSDKVTCRLSVDPFPEGAEYGFLKDAKGFYYSTNEGVGDSASVARIDITAKEACLLRLRCYNGGELGEDFGIIYAVDVVPRLSAEMGDVHHKMFSAENDPLKEISVEMEIPEGKHFVYVKYRKNSSVDMEGEGFRFRAEVIPRDGGPVNWLTDRIKLSVDIDGIRYPMGVYIPATISERGGDGEVILSIEGYSILYQAERVKLESPLVFKAGLYYFSAIEELLLMAGITWYEMEPTALVLSTDREWEVGVSIISIINELLDEINYRSAWVDLAGKVRITKYAAPSPENIRHEYAAGEFSVLSGDWARTNDYFGKANVFRCVCSNPEIGEPLVAVAENTDPENPYSVEKLGTRIMHLEEVDNVPNLSVLQERADNLLMKSLQVVDEVEFQTAIMPNHGCFDVIALDDGDLTGIFEETGWNCSLGHSGAMVHTARRIRWG